jgi:hypothetical protein
VGSLDTLQKENFKIEDDVLGRLNLLKTLNGEVEHIYKKQVA